MSKVNNNLMTCKQFVNIFKKILRYKNTNFDNINNLTNQQF